jgi:hypothetical protein
MSSEIDLDDLIKRVLRRVKWLDEKCEIYDGEVLIQLKIIDQFNKSLVSLLRLLQFKNLSGTDSSDELLKLISEAEESL